MKFQFPTLVAAIIAVSLFSSSASADSVAYMQASNGTPGDSSAQYNVSTDPGFTQSSDSDSQSWAYFAAPASSSFNRISWNGSNTDGNFAIDFFSATCFSCGATLVGTDGTTSHSVTPQNSQTLFPNNGSFSQSQVNKTFVSGSEYSYYVDINANIAVNQGTIYALSIVNNYTSLPFAWSASSANNGLIGTYRNIDLSGMHLKYVVGQSIFLPASGNLAFTLSSVTPVPEPETFAMLLAGLGLIGAAVSRRKAKQA
jgi:hypothetical protein